MSTIGLQRAARIKAVHAACRRLGIDDDTRRDIQLSLTGKASLSDMHSGEVSRVLDHLNGRGNDHRDDWRFVFRLAADRQAIGKKIYRLAERIGAAQEPPVPVMGKRYIEGITEQMRGCQQPLEFCDAGQLRKVVQALEIYCKRHWY
ncbi:phage protein GemA/Gp16 family protein [Azonexus sp.]|jgi:phage gp16-like protein|uniref:phage protein GemA/Gp16 family protein n=1 Tax=Azonexus sp. TaxID=1872668 RepID=UPI00282B9F9F|nr:phage protein GemA/Gp16 family protein [Azonexus sp.]MDR1995124.1 regulatory protein GemA [Azonexus sp.]